MRTTKIPPEPYPLDELELTTALECVTHEIRFYVDNAGDLEPEEVYGEYMVALIGTWNALEQFLAWRQQRPQRNLIGESLDITYEVSS